MATDAQIKKINTLIKKYPDSCSNTEGNLPQAAPQAESFC